MLVVFLCSVYQRESLHDVIHVRGCIHAVNLWMSDNIGITVALCCAIGLPQVIENPEQRVPESEPQERVLPNALSQPLIFEMRMPC